MKRYMFFVFAMLFLFSCGFYNFLGANAGVLFFTVKDAKPLVLLYKNQYRKHYNVLGGRTENWYDSKMKTAVMHATRKTAGGFGSAEWLFRQLEGLKEELIIASCVYGNFTPYLTYLLYVEYKSADELSKWCRQSRNYKRNYNCFAWVELEALCEVINNYKNNNDSNASCFNCTRYPDGELIFLEEVFIKGLFEGKNCYDEPLQHIIENFIGKKPQNLLKNPATSPSSLQDINEWDFVKSPATSSSSILPVFPSQLLVYLNGDEECLKQ